MNVKFPAYLFAMVLIASCETFRPYYVTYKASVADYSQLAEIGIRVRNVGARWNLGIYEKNVDRLSRPSLFMGLCFDDRVVLHVTNIGHTIFLSATDVGEMPLEDLDRLIQEVLGELEALGLEFKLRESS